MKLIYSILVLVLAPPSHAAYWGVAAEFADWSPSQSEYEAPVLAQRGVGTVFLNMHGCQRNWPNWVKVNEAWRAANISTIWDLSVCISECERIYGRLPGAMGIDDRAVLQSGARVYFGEKPRLGNIFLPALSEHAKRIAQTMAMRLARPAGCRITANAQFYQGSHDNHALASWRAFLERFFGDDSPGRDTNGDTATLNSAFGASYASWDQVPRTPLVSGRADVGPLRDIWLASSYADFVERLSAPMSPLLSGGSVGPGVAGVRTATVDASLLAAQKHIESIYTDRWASIPALESVAFTFGKKLIACPAMIGAVDLESSLQDVLKALPYVDGMIFDYNDLTKRASALSEDPDGPPAEIREFSRGFRIIPMLAPFAGRLRVDRAPVLWISSRGMEEKDFERIVDASCVSEATLALYPDSVDLSRFKAVIYASASPCISTTILQRLFEYALKGGVVFIDAWNVASGPTLHGREQSSFWWELMRPIRSEFGKGETTISHAGGKWSMKGTMPYLAAASEAVREVGAVTDSNGAAYPLALVRKMGKTGKWVLVNVPGAWRKHPDLLRAVVREEAGVDLPDPSETRVYTGDRCALAVGGTKLGPAAIPCAYPEAVAFDVKTREVETVTPVDGLARLSTKLTPGEARLWVVKPYGRPVVLYTDGGIDHAATIADGEYRDGVLRFTFAERAFVSSPKRPKALTVDGKPAPFNYDPEHHVVGIGAVGAGSESPAQQRPVEAVLDY